MYVLCLSYVLSGLFCLLCCCCCCCFEASLIKVLTAPPSCSLLTGSDITTEDATSCHRAPGPGDLELCP